MTAKLSETDKPALDLLFSSAYEELKRLANTVRAGSPNDSLNPTALVNESYIKLAKSLRIVPQSRLHFKRIAARAMRQVLVEAARRRGAEKRGGGQAFVTFDEGLDGADRSPEELVALDLALKDLARVNARQASVVECRFFGGLDLVEIAALLEVSETTVQRDWRVAKAWLGSELRREV